MLITSIAVVNAGTETSAATAVAAYTTATALLCWPFVCRTNLTGKLVGYEAAPTHVNIG